jgi:tripartite-type tricarboxylate transporter receptor subunit TctC
MTSSRASAFWCLTALILAIDLSPPASRALALDYPTRPIKLIVSFAPGGLTDIPARLLAAEMQQRLGQPVIVENRAGASGIVGGTFVFNADPDGYTLLVSAVSEVQNLYYLSVPYRFAKDFTQIGKVADGPALALIVKGDSPFNSVQDVIAFAKQNPTSFATSGPATSPAIAVAQFNSIAKTDIQGVPYRGTGPAAAAVMSGEVQGGFVFYPTAKPLVDSGKVRVLAVASKTRLESWKDVPTMIELVFARFEHNAFVGLSGPAHLPPEIVARLNSVLNDAIKSPDLRARLEVLGMAPPSGGNTPEAFSKFLEGETAFQAELAKIAGEGSK